MLYRVVVCKNDEPARLVSCDKSVRCQADPCGGSTSAASQRWVDLPPRWRRRCAVRKYYVSGPSRPRSWPIQGLVDIGAPTWVLFGKRGSLQDAAEKGKLIEPLLVARAVGKEVPRHERCVARLFRRDDRVAAALQYAQPEAACERADSRERVSDARRKLPEPVWLARGVLLHPCERSPHRAFTPAQAREIEACAQRFERAVRRVCGTLRAAGNREQALVRAVRAVQQRFAHVGQARVRVVATGVLGPLRYARPRRLGRTRDTIAQGSIVRARERARATKWAGS